MIVPSLSAVLTNSAPTELGGDNRPLLGSVALDQLDEVQVFVGGPGGSLVGVELSVEEPIVNILVGGSLVHYSLVQV